MNATNLITWNCKEFKIFKYDNQESYISKKPSSVESYPGNTITLNGLTTLWNLIIGNGLADGSEASAAGQGFYPFSQNNLRIGVGTSTTSAQITDTKLNDGLAYEPIVQQEDSSYIKIATTTSNSGVTMTIMAEFDANTANGAWNEWGIFNGDPSNATGMRVASTEQGVGTPGVDYNIVMLNHKVEAMGTKPNGSTWVVQVSIEFQNGGN